MLTRPFAFQPHIIPSMRNITPASSSNPHLPRPESTGVQETATGQEITSKAPPPGLGHVAPRTSGREKDGAAAEHPVATERGIRKSGVLEVGLERKWTKRREIERSDGAVVMSQKHSRERHVDKSTLSDWSSRAVLYPTSAQKANMSSTSLPTRNSPRGQSVLFPLRTLAVSRSVEKT
ncbi:hypothetical protein NL676_004444 [Syzygium grande]|nr:hypothetical protein NL676_004444 [Syzygium grande]